MSGGDDARIHRLIQALLDQPEPERQRWLAKTLPDDPELRARLMAAVGDRNGPAGAGKFPLAFGAVSLKQSAIPAKIGRYEIRERLGSGGMGVLYRAVDPALNRPVAVKLLRFNDDEMRERFMREARAAAGLDHRNIVTIFDVGEHEGQPFIAMEYIAGETVGDLICRRAPLPLAQRVRLIADLCDGLAWAHKSRIIHRDVKPANVMVTQDGTLKIIDFGIARLVDSGMTQTRGIVGTPHYMSPEQLEGRAADHLSDIFSVGLVMYELLSFHRAFPGEVPHVVATHILAAEPRPLSELVPGIDPDLVKVVTRALQKRPQDRYPHLTAMRADLMRVVTRLQSATPGTVIAEGHQGVIATPRDSMTGWRLLTRVPPVVAAAGVGGVMVIAITMAATLWRQPTVEPPVSSTPTSEFTPASQASPPPAAEPVTPVSRVVPDPLDSVVAPPRPAFAGPSPPPAPGGGTSLALADRIATLMKEAEAFRLRREYDAAIVRYLEVQGLAPLDDMARAGLSETRTAKQRAEEALERIAGPSRESSLIPSSAETEAQRLVEVALKALEAGDDATAQTALEEALRVDPRTERAQKVLKILTGR